MTSRSLRNVLAGVVAGGALACSCVLPAADDAKYDPISEADKVISKMEVKAGDSPQLGKSYYRNNVTADSSIPTEFDATAGTNIKWGAKLGSQTYSSPVIANGKVFVGSNNANGYIKRYPARVDLGVMLC